VSTDITSTANPRVRRLLDLRDRRHREKEKRFLIEGMPELRRALQSGVVIESLFYDGEDAPDLVELLEVVRSAGAEVVAVSPAVAARVCVRGGPVLAVAEPFPLGLDSFQPSTPEFILVMERIEKPGNLGAMLRTAASVGAAVLVADRVTDLFNPSVVRASLGALFAVSIGQADAQEVRSWLGARSVRMLAAIPRAPTSLWEADLGGSVAIAVGAEDIGLSEELLEGTELISIPMVVGSDSLNASVAAAVCLYEAARQRKLAEP
jgi:TrmH family RNA methyltransferase